MDMEALGRFIVTRAASDEDVAVAVLTSPAAEGRPQPVAEWKADEETGYVLVEPGRALSMTTVILRVLWECCGDDWTSVTPEQEELARLLAHPWRHHSDFDPAWAYKFPTPPAPSDEGSEHC